MFRYHRYCCTEINKERSSSNSKVFELKKQSIVNETHIIYCTVELRGLVMTHEVTRSPMTFNAASVPLR